MARQLRVVGVPEHFTFPWLRSLELNKGVNVAWRECPGGTGEMMSELREGRADLAVALTEGAVKAAMETPDKIRILGTYVASPLMWGIHVGKASLITELTKEQKVKVRFAISRKGSGSHLMAYVLAKKLGWDATKLEFLEVGTIEGAKRELSKHSDLVFLWEKAMTHPLVVSNVFNRIGEIPTPWPSFVFAVNPAFLVTHADVVGKVLVNARRECQAFKQNREESISAVVRKHGLERNTATEWFDAVQFACAPVIKPEVLVQVYDMLSSVGLVPSSVQKTTTKGKAFQGDIITAKL